MPSYPHYTPPTRRPARNTNPRRVDIHAHAFQAAQNTEREGNKCPPYPHYNPPNRRTTRNTNPRRVGIYAHASSLF